MSAIIVKNLVKTFGKGNVIDDVSFSVDPGEMDTRMHAAALPDADPPLRPFAPLRAGRFAIFFAPPALLLACAFALFAWP